MKIALVGNPNSGKTTLFNFITGKKEKIGNWSGVTINEKYGVLKKTLIKHNEDIDIIDLPGVYSISPFTNEESITKKFILEKKPDVIINIVDSTNLDRSLFFTTQLLELNVPVVVALNKVDLLKKQGIKINIKLLESLLFCPVIETVSLSGKTNGIKELLKKSLDTVGSKQKSPFNKKTTSNTKNDIEKEDQMRYEFVKEIISKVEKTDDNENKLELQDKVDRILAHKFLGLPIFAFVMWMIFSISQKYVGPFFADILSLSIDKFRAFVEGLLGNNVSPILSSILLDGIIGGVGAVIGFLPLIMVLFFLIALLEDSGYMARIAVIMDDLFRKIGLNGKSIIPIIIGTGCAIPGIMSTRTIKNERQRKTTAMLTPFMPCGAKLPVIALFSGVFFNGSAWIGTLMYFLGILIVIIGALIVVKITGEDFEQSFFIMELPQYKKPSLKNAVSSMIERGKAFVIKAGTVILLCNTTIQVMQSFNFNLQAVDPGSENSILAVLATPFSYLLIPLGFGVWQLASAAITGFIAKESVVGTLAVVYSITNFINVEEFTLVSGSSQVAQIIGLSKIAALSYLMFNLFTPPCFAAIGAMNSELESRKWLWGGIAFQFSTGYTVSFITYQLGTLITTKSFGAGFIPGLIFVLLLVSIVLYLIYNTNKKSKNSGENTCKI